MRTALVVVMLGVFWLSGCGGQGNERLAEKAGIEGRASSEAGIEAQNQNLQQKASEMEADLARRHRFYQAVKGTYEGALMTEQGEFSVRMSFVPSLPPYETRRTRQLEEIVADLNNLYLNVQVVQWNPVNRLSAVGCRIQNVRPDISTGEILIAAETCPNFYSLRVSDHSTPAAAGKYPDSSGVALAIRDGRMSRVSDIVGEVHPTTNASVYSMRVSRLER